MSGSRSKSAPTRAIVMLWRGESSQREASWRQASVLRHPALERGEILAHERGELGAFLGLGDLGALERRYSRCKDIGPLTFSSRSMLEILIEVHDALAERHVFDRGLAGRLDPLEVLMSMQRIQAREASVPAQETPPSAVAWRMSMHAEPARSTSRTSS